MKVLFLQTAHPETDDRIIHQMGTLRRAGIACTYASKRTRNDQADIVLCDTPRAVLRNLGHTGTIIYDVTEWYPSKKNLRAYSPLLRPAVAMAMVFLSILAGAKANRFIYGEESKSYPFRILFAWKKWVLLPYYPSQNLFRDIERKTSQKTKILYAGPRTEEKGYYRARRAAEGQNVELTTLTPEQYMPLTDFCRYIQGFDIALDLRDRDIENQHCLPIKLFYYWAAGVVPIYSDLKAIRKHIPDVEEAGILVRSEEEAAQAIRELSENKEKRRLYREKGRQMFQNRYNWERTEANLLRIIQ